MLTRTALTLLILAAPALAADPPLPEGAIARLGSPHWRNLTDGNINSLIAFSPNGKSVITQGYGAVHVVDFDSGVECWRVDGIRSELSLALAPGNRLILCERNSLRTYDLETGKKLREIPRPAQNCGHLATDGKQLVFQDLYGKAPMAAVSLDLESGQQRWQYDGARSDLCYPVAFIPGRSELALRVYRHPDTILRIIDPNTLRVLREWKLPANSDVGRINPAVLSPDGKLICTGGDKLVRFWDVATGKEHSVLSGHMDAVVQVAFSGDGKRLVTSGRDLTLRCWICRAEKNLERSNATNCPTCLRFHPMARGSPRRAPAATPCTGST
jgi:WD40 repeat protein